MFRSYIPSLIGFVAGIGIIVYMFAIYPKSIEPDNIEYGCTFNAMTMENKLIGKTYTEISQKYLPPVSVKSKGRKGNMNARYENLRIFTKGENTISYGMNITYKDSVATDLVIDEPSKSKDAFFVNAMPLSYLLIDMEFMTRDRSPLNNSSAKGWQIPLLLLFGLLLINLPFLLLWPLTTYIVNKTEAPWANIFPLLLWLVGYWLYIGIVAYSNGSAILFVVLGVIWIIVADIILNGSVDQADLSHIHNTAGPRVLNTTTTYTPVSNNSGGGSNTSGPVYATCLSHISNLAAVLGTSKGHQSMERASVVATFAQKHGIDMNDFDTAIGKGTVDVTVPSNKTLYNEFRDNIARILLCDATMNNLQLGVAAKMLESYGIDRDSLSGFLDGISQKEYGRTFPGDYNIVMTS